MATIVLTAVGTAVGGPIGGAIGALVGQRIDSELFGPRLHGPRLDTLAVQSSRYGTALPLIHGRARTAGTVIWATELTERRSTAGGKGQPKTTTYSYSADFAVALSARPIRRVGRIWADGTLLTDADGKLSVDGRMRVHLGSEDQAPDALIAQEEAAAPAYRGLAYAVFEELALESFGNRIPMLSFEVIADEEPVAIGPLIQALSDGTVSPGDVPHAAVGAAFGGGSRRDAVAALAEPLSLAVGGDGALFGPEDGRVAVTLASGSLGARKAGDAPAPATLADRPAATSVALEFAEPARDYQPGRQRAAAGGPDARPAEWTLPLVLDAATAKGWAFQRLDAGAGAARTATVTVPLTEGLALAPGDRVRLPDRPGVWRVTDWLLERMVVRLELEPVRASALPEAATDGGRAVPSRPAPGGGTVCVHLLDLPYVGDGEARVFAVVGRSDGSRRPLPLLLDTGGAVEPIGPSAPAATLGTLVEPPGAASPLLLDRANALTVELLAPADLTDADAAQLSAGANAALVGEEVLQWGRAEPLCRARPGGSPTCCAGGAGRRRRSGRSGRATASCCWSPTRFSRSPRRARGPICGLARSDRARRRPCGHPKPPRIAPDHPRFPPSIPAFSPVPTAQSSSVGCAAAGRAGAGPTARTRRWVRSGSAIS